MSESQTTRDRSERELTKFKTMISHLETENKNLRNLVEVANQQSRDLERDLID